MTRDQAKRIVKHIALIEHYAKGGDIEFAQHNYRGEFLGWTPNGCSQLVIACLPNYRISKPRVRIVEGARFERAT